ncbi:MAG: fructose-bisphosphatase class II, partial [Armatimonadota bacterium]
SAAHNVDISAGIGGSPEGVIAAVIVKCYRGLFEQRPWFSPDADGARLRERHAGAGLDPDAILTMEDLAMGHVFFSCT